MLSALSNYENPASMITRHTGGLSKDQYRNISLRKDMAAEGVAYTMPAKAVHSTVKTKTAREMFFEIFSEYTRSTRLNPALEEALRYVDDAWLSAVAIPVKPVAEWISVVNDMNAAVNVPALYKTISAVSALMKEANALEKVDNALRQINVRDASLQHVIAVLRTLSPHKTHLSEWKHLRDNLMMTVEARKDQLKVSPEIFMRGLWQDE